MRDRFNIRTPQRHDFTKPVPTVKRPKVRAPRAVIKCARVSKLRVFAVVCWKNVHNTRPMKISPTAETRFLRAAVGVLVVIAAAAIWWLCETSPNINFLPNHGPGVWIVYPQPPSTMSFPGLKTVANFRRTFQLNSSPTTAPLAVRAFKSFEIKVNGTALAAPALQTSNWKNAIEFDAASLLHPGTNEILVTVYNDNAPPALWLTLNSGGTLITSGADWKVSLLGAAWREAWTASAPMPFEKNTSLAAGEFAIPSLRESGPWLAGCTLLAAVLVYFGNKLVTRKTAGDDGKNPDSKWGSRWAIALILVWVALCLNNLPWLPRTLGYDSGAHSDYINYIRTKSALPLASEGWEMYQPPLYYIIGAGITSASGVPTASDGAAIGLRIFGMLVGVAHILAIFFALRLLFPGRLAAQFFGLLLAACLPEHLYISQYITNEGLAAALVSAAVYFCLREWNKNEESAGTAIAAGLCLGAALLTKFTAVLVIPFITAVFVMRIYRRADSAEPGTRWRAIAIFFATMLLVSGWHYIRVWKHFGTPIVGNWDSASHFSWWMDKGFQTFHSMSSFGQSLIQPRFSAFHGFWDGIYSTLWGDSLDGGAADMEFRPPWNYKLMAAGILLALLPTTVIVLGFVVSVIRFLRRPDTGWFVVLGILVTTYVALIYMNLRMPYYGNAKAFYALITLLPMCACGAAGWEILVRWLGKFKPALYVAIGVWALNVYATFWIRGGAAATHLVRGNYFHEDRFTEKAIAEFNEALAIDPHNADARVLLATTFGETGDLDASRREILRVLSEAPDNPNALMQLALLQAADRHADQSIETTRRIIQVAPDFSLAYEHLCRALIQSGKSAEAVDIARENLRITPYQAEIHMLLGAALNAHGEYQEAAAHLQLATDLRPNLAQAHDQLGISLAQLGQLKPAIAQFSQACRLQPERAEFALHLGETHGRAGQFDEAIASVKNAISIAEQKHESRLLTNAQKMLEALEAARSSHSN